MISKQPLEHHGNEGPLSVSDMAFTALAEKFVLAGRELGYERVDVNGPNQLGQFALTWFCVIQY